MQVFIKSRNGTMLPWQAFTLHDPVAAFPNQFWTLAVGGKPFPQFLFW